MSSHPSDATMRKKVENILGQALAGKPKHIAGCKYGDHFYERHLGFPPTGATAPECTCWIGHAQRHFDLSCPPDGSAVDGAWYLRKLFGFHVVHYKPLGIWAWTEDGETILTLNYSEVTYTIDGGEHGYEKRVEMTAPTSQGFLDVMNLVFTRTWKMEDFAGR